MVGVLSPAFLARRSSLDGLEELDDISISSASDKNSSPS